MASGEPVDLVEINGQQLRGGVRDGLLADLGADPEMAEVLARVPDAYHLSGPGESTTRAFPLAVTRGVHTTGIYYNKALLDRAGLQTPATIADLRRWWPVSRPRCRALVRLRPATSSSIRSS
jgi:ABC-type glycerol-3-phosphate transport system substrate-binding protein